MLLLQADWIIVTVYCTDFQTLRSSSCKESRTLQLDSLPFHISSAMLPLHSVISVTYQSVYQLRSWEDVDIFRRQIFFCCCSTLWNALPTSLMKSKQFNTLTPYSKQTFLNKHLILSIFNFIFFENFIRF